MERGSESVTITSRKTEFLSRVVVYGLDDLILGIICSADSNLNLFDRCWMRPDGLPFGFCGVKDELRELIWIY